MEHFAALFNRLDQTTSINEKVDALAAYFLNAPEKDRLWAIALLSRRRPKRTVNTTRLREWAAEAAALPLWLFEESYHVVGDLAETIALALPHPEQRIHNDLATWINQIRDLEKVDDTDRKQFILEAWNGLDSRARFLFNKLITGNFRVGISQQLVVRALAKATGLEENVLAHRLMGDWTPDTIAFEQLIHGGDDGLADTSKPYPFFLAYQLEGNVGDLGQPLEWQAEYKWDGIRGQVIVRQGQLFVWSRGEELVTDRFPEFHALPDLLPSGTVIDGEIIPWADGLPMPFQSLQTRIGRKNVTKKVMQETPVVLLAYDLLEHHGSDLRSETLQYRRQLLTELLLQHEVGTTIRLSSSIPFEDWDALASIRESAREHNSEGLMLKRLDSPYRSGRRKGDWWKWKVDPLTIDAVMIYAQRGHGRRANLYTDYTFAVWEGDHLVPFTKAYSGLTDDEFRRVTTFVNKNTVERFGPVRSVTPELVFEIAFEGIQVSSRHKSGIALRFPRISRWRHDKKPEEANTLSDLKALLNHYQG